MRYIDTSDLDKSSWRKSLICRVVIILLVIVMTILLLAQM